MSVEGIIFAFAVFGVAVFSRFVWREWRYLRRRREWHDDMRRRYEREKWEVNQRKE